MGKQVILSFTSETPSDLAQKINSYAERNKLKVKVISAYSDNEKWYSERAIVVFES